MRQEKPRGRTGGGQGAVNGRVGSAMRTIALKQAPRGHASAVAATVLRGLGVPDEEALAVASLPLPDFPPE